MYNRAFPVGNALFFFTGGVMSLLCLPCSKFSLPFLAVPAGKDGWVECPCQTVDDFIGIRGSVCGLFLFVQTHAPLDIGKQHTMCLLLCCLVFNICECGFQRSEIVLMLVNDPDASILHLSGGLHNYRDGLDCAGIHSLRKTFNDLCAFFNADDPAVQRNMIVGGIAPLHIGIEAVVGGAALVLLLQPGFG